MCSIKRPGAFYTIICLVASVYSSFAVSLSKDFLLRNRFSRSLSDENKCYNLGLHATCMGTLSSRKEDQKTLVQLLSSSKLPPNIQHLTISYNVDLSSNNLHVLENLLELNISNNAIAPGTMDQNFLSHFPRLSTLKIVKSGLTTLPIFRDRHPTLVNLVLNHNSIESWSEASLRSLPGLKSLHLTGNNITAILVGQFPEDCQLEELSVGNNRISRIDSLVGTNRLKRLRIFRLGRNHLHVSLNQSASQSQKSRPDIFPHFPTVEVLDLSRNGLEFIPPLMFREWSRLRELRLKRNRLQFFGAGSFFIEKGGLQLLDLSFNRVSTVNREVTYGLDELITLQLSKNHIRTVQTDAFEKLKKLQHLYLEENQLSFIGSIFDPLSSLETLQLSSNPNLAQLPNNAFGGLHRLKELDLSNNSIHVIDDKVFEALNQLRRLSLANNRLALIRGGYFSGLVGLEELDLRGNNITGVEESESNDLKSMIFLRKLHMQTSHYHCGLCSLRAFVSWLRSKGFAEPDVLVKCASPPDLRGSSVLALRQPANCDIGLVPKVIGHLPSEAKLVGHNLSLVCTILSNLQPVVAWQRAPLPPDATVAKPASGVGVSVMSASSSAAAASSSGMVPASGDGGPPALIGRPVYSDLLLGPDQVTLVRSDKEWRAQLRLVNLNTTDSGLYRCSVTVKPSAPAAATTAIHAAGPIRSIPAVIRVLAPPRLDQRPAQRYEAREGESLEIPCSSSGFPKPEQSLRRLGNFPAAVERRLTLPGDAGGAPARFGIRHLTSADSGRYVCISENAAGRLETPFELEVFTKPRFLVTEWPARVAVRPGGDRILDCSVSGSPAPVNAWFHNDRRVGSNRTAASIGGSEDSSKLRLSSVVASDSGVYRCEATNSMGSVSRRVQLVVTDSPTELSDGSIDAPSGSGGSRNSSDEATSTVSTSSTVVAEPVAGFSLLIFAVIVSAMSCVLLTTLLWSVVFIFLRRKSRQTKRSLNARLAEERAHREQLCRSEPSLQQQQQQYPHQSQSQLHQLTQSQQLHQQYLFDPQQHRIPLMVSSMMALPHSVSGGDIFTTGGSHPAPLGAPPLPPYHILLHQQQQQQQRHQLPSQHVVQHQQMQLHQQNQQQPLLQDSCHVQHLPSGASRRYGGGGGANATAVHRSEPDLIVSGLAGAVGSSNAGRFPLLLQHQSSYQPQSQQQQQQQHFQKPGVLLLARKSSTAGISTQQQQQQAQAASRPSGPALPPETSDYNTGSASSGDSVEHLRFHNSGGTGSHLQHRNLLMSHQGQVSDSGYCSQSGSRHQRPQQQQQQPQPQQQQHSLCGWGPQQQQQQQRAAVKRSGSSVSSSSSSCHHPLLVRQLQQQTSLQAAPHPAGSVYHENASTQHLCSSFTGQRSPSTTDFDSGYEPSGSLLARPRSSRSSFSVNGGIGVSVIAVRESEA